MREHASLEPSSGGPIATIQGAPHVPRRYTSRMETSLPRTAAEGSRVTVPSMFKRLVSDVAARLRPQPDLSMVNMKFTDSLERELIARAARGTWRTW